MTKRDERMPDEYPVKDSWKTGLGHTYNVLASTTTGVFLGHIFSEGTSVGYITGGLAGFVYGILNAANIANSSESGESYENEPVSLSVLQEDDVATNYVVRRRNGLTTRFVETEEGEVERASVVYEQKMRNIAFEHDKSMSKIAKSYDSSEKYVKGASLGEVEILSE